MAAGFLYQPNEVEEVLECPWCASLDWVPWCEKYDNFLPVKCNKCGVVFLKNRLNEKGRNRFYKDYVKLHETPERLAPRLIMYGQEFKVISNIVERGDILDIGCGSGRFLNLFPADRYNRFGLEYGKEAALIARKTIGEEFIFEGGLLEAAFPENKFDLIIFRGVIEHLPNPKKILEKACMLVKKKGCLFITSMPNLDCICASIYKSKWTQHREFEHIVHFGKNHFREFFKEKGFSEMLDQELYWQTPYANPEEDILEVAGAIRMKRDGNKHIKKTSPAFWGNILSTVFRKDI